MTPVSELAGLASSHGAAELLVEGLAGLIALLCAVALRRRRLIIRAQGFALIGVGLLADLVAGLHQVAPGYRPYFHAVGVMLLAFGVIRLVADAIDYIARRERTHFSTISKALVLTMLYVIVGGVILREELRVDLTSILATSAVISVVVGFGLQETLGNIFSGLTLQLQKPFLPGDWVQCAGRLGRVEGIGWRSTRLLTRANERLDIPNALLAKDALVNYHHGGGVADEVTVGVSYDAPPNRVREIVVKLLRDLPGVLHDPAPTVLAWEYGDSAIRYRVKYWLRDYGTQEQVRDAVVSTLWYALRRHALEIPYPIRTLELRGEAKRGRAALESSPEIVRELRQVDFLRALNEEELRVLAASVSLESFGRGEVLVREGEPGDAFYVIRRGTVEVLARAEDGRTVHIRDLTRPAFFGEMALMTGEPRNATVRAVSDVEVLRMDRDGFTHLFKAHPEAVAEIGDVIAARLSERREMLAAVSGADGQRGRRSWLLAKMREVFDL